MLHGKCLTTSRDARRRPRRRRHRTQRTPRTRFRTAHMSRRCLRACHPRRHDVAEPLAPARVLHMTARTHGLGFTPHLHLRASGRWAPQASSLISRWGLTSATCSIVLSTRSDMPLKNERPRCMNMALNAPPENESSTTARTSTASSGQSRHTPRPSSHCYPLNVSYSPKGTVRASSQIGLGMPWDEHPVAMDNLIPRSRLRSSVRAAESGTI